MFISAVFYNIQDMEATWMPIKDEWVKIIVVHTYNRILFSQKKEWNHAIYSGITWHGCHIKKTNYGHKVGRVAGGIHWELELTYTDY